MSRVAQTWWPLAASWLLMAIEGPMVSAIVARLAEPEINLAAWGVVSTLSMIIEAPIIMLLSASTALSKDWASFAKVRRFMMAAGASLTVLHILLAFTPLSRWVIGTMIGAPAEIVEPARLGLMLMTPWTWSIAFRRFNQGVLIRFGRSRSVSVGSAVRLMGDAVVLTVGYLVGSIPGAAVGSAALAVGVMSEAAFIGYRTRPLHLRLREAKPVQPPLTLRPFLAFYIPLAMTSLMGFLMQPIGTAGLSRMPRPLESLAVWPVLSGLFFLFRSIAMAYNEVVVALLDERGSSPTLRRFMVLLGAGTTGLLLLVAATSLSTLYFERLSALNPDLVALARQGIWFALPMPALTAMQSWAQGAIVHSRHTRGITEAVAISLVTTAALLAAGVAWGGATGLLVGAAALTIGALAQTAWLWHRSRPAARAVRERDAELEAV